MTIKVYRVSGMTCGGCAKHVEKPSGPWLE